MTRHIPVLADGIHRNGSHWLRAARSCEGRVVAAGRSKDCFVPGIDRWVAAGDSGGYIGKPQTRSFLRLRLEKERTEGLAPRAKRLKQLVLQFGS